MKSVQSQKLLCPNALLYFLDLDDSEGNRPVILRAVKITWVGWYFLMIGFRDGPLAGTHRRSAVFLVSGVPRLMGFGLII